MNLNVGRAVSFLVSRVKGVSLALLVSCASAPESHSDNQPVDQDQNVQAGQPQLGTVTQALGEPCSVSADACGQCQACLDDGLDLD
ncbi:MAG TPA: hypothetical protein VHO25_13955, partial [Polyangiaceae bacterium]|nr:hypothetical protein [Polyangiaceae bacterium]